MTKLDLSRLCVYGLGLVGSLAAFFGIADFDAVSGVIDPRPFNLYALFGAVPSGLAGLALLKGWGTRG